MGCVMSRKLPVLFIFSVTVLASFVAFGPSLRSNSPVPSLSSSLQPANSGAAHARILSSYGKLPLTFEQNLGQTDSRVRFLAHAGDYALFLTSQETVLRLEAPVTKDTRVAAPPAPGSVKTSQTVQESSAIVRLALAGSNPHSPVEGLDLQLGRSNYFIGNDPAKWHRGVPQYARIKYSDVYPGVDLIYYGNQGRLESDYVLAPGADPKQIALRIDGAENLSINSSGDLVLAASTGEVLLHRPSAYQEINGTRQEIACSFVQRGSHIIGIELAPFDSTRALIVDPVLFYSTYLGGSGTDQARAVAADSSGNAFVTGTTTSSDFPLKGALQSTLNSTTRGNVFITELNSTGTALVFSTFLGGTAGNGLGENGDTGNGIALDSLGNVYVAGSTGSTDFPVSSTPFQATNKGIATSAFLSKLDPAGASLLYSTYIGGNGGEFCNGLAVDKATGNAYITGITSSQPYPTIASTAIQTANNSGESVFVSRFDPTQIGTGSLIYSTLLGGAVAGKVDTGLAIAVDSNANAYVTGSTSSSTFPITPSTAFQTSLTATGSFTNAFFSQIDTNTPNHLVYSTFLGGTGVNGGDAGIGIALDPTFNAYVAGQTGSTDFPTTPGAFQLTTKNTRFTAFVTRFDTTKPQAASRVYSTLLGGTTDESAVAVVVDPLSDAFVTGSTSSIDFPLTIAASQRTLAGAQNAFLSELNPTGTGLLFSTYHGGESIDFAHGIALDTTASQNVYIAGATLSAKFPTTTGAFQTTSKSKASPPQTAFVAKFSPAAAAGVFVNPPAISFGTVNVGSPSSSQAVTLINNTKTTLTGIAITFTGADPTDFSQTDTCGTTLAATSTCTINVVFTPTTSAAESATLSIAFTGASGSPQTVALSGTGSGSAQPDFTLSVTPSPLSVTAGGTGNFTVTVTSLNSFSAVVALTCTGVPLNSACTLLPTSVTPPSGGTQTSAGTITPHALLPPSSPSFPRLRPVGILGIFALLLALLMAKTAARRGARKLAWGFALLGVLALAGCSGVPGGGGGGSGGTPKGTSTITITGTSGSLSHTTTFSFTVN